MSSQFSDQWLLMDGMQYLVLVSRYHRVRALKELGVAPLLSEVRHWVRAEGKLSDDVGRFGVISVGVAVYELVEQDYDVNFEVFWRSVLQEDVEDGEYDNVARVLANRFGFAELAAAFRSSGVADELCEDVVATEVVGDDYEFGVEMPGDVVVTCAPKVFVQEQSSLQVDAGVVSAMLCKLKSEFGVVASGSTVQDVAHAVLQGFGFYNLPFVEIERSKSLGSLDGCCYLRLFREDYWSRLFTVLGEYPDSTLVGCFIALAVVAGFYVGGSVELVGDGLLHVDGTGEYVEPVVVLRQMVVVGRVCGGSPVYYRLMSGKHDWRYASSEVPIARVVDGKALATLEELTINSAGRPVMWYRVQGKYDCNDGLLVYNLLPGMVVKRDSDGTRSLTRDSRLVTYPGTSFRVGVPADEGYGFSKEDESNFNQYRALPAVSRPSWCPEVCEIPFEFVDDVSRVGRSDGVRKLDDSVSRFVAEFAGFHVQSGGRVDAENALWNVVELHDVLNQWRTYNKFRLEVVGFVGRRRVQINCHEAVILYALRPKSARLYCRDAVLRDGGALAVCPDVYGRVTFVVEYNGMDDDDLDRNIVTLRTREICDHYCYDNGGPSDDEGFERVIKVPSGGGFLD